MICFRVTEAEKQRIETVVERAQQRNRLAVRTDVLKDLIGLTDLGLVDDEDRYYLLGDGDSSNEPEILPIIDTRAATASSQRAAEVTDISKRGRKKKA